MNKQLAGQATAREFYQHLRREVMQGNPQLNAVEQARLRSHYGVMMTPAQNPPALAAQIYAERRQYPVAAIMATQSPIVFDAGCAYGSESFLFASLGARVLAVDSDPECTRIARLRQAYFEYALGCKFDITFCAADLDEYTPQISNLSLTWFASVLAAIPHQENLLQRIRKATRDGGQLMITDMNLWNPLFFLSEWRRRKRAAQTNPQFAHAQNFRAMFARQGRSGARYYSHNGTTFDDVQFFQPASLCKLYQATGWKSPQFYFSGYIPPVLARRGLTALEPIFARMPLLTRMGYFYLGVGVNE